MLQDVLRTWVLINNLDVMMGRVTEFTPPKLTRILEHFRGCGMDTTVPIDMGMETMVSSWEVAGQERGMYSAFGILNSLGPTVVTLRGTLITPMTGVPKIISHVMTGIISEVDPGTYKPGERAPLKVQMHPIHYKMTHSLPGVPVVEIDSLAGVRFAAGIDQTLALRLMAGI